MSTFFFLLMQFAVMAYELIAGFLLAVSDFIMRSLSRTVGTSGFEVMQAINREVFRWIFMTLLLGVGVASLVIVGYAATSHSDPGGTLALLAGLVYVAGCFGDIMVRNVSMNEALERCTGDAIQSADGARCRHARPRHDVDHGHPCCIAARQRDHSLRPRT